MAVRVQITLFLPPPVAEQVEAVRRVLDPVQLALIPAHVTLCRDEELEGLGPELLQRKLRAAGELGPLTLTFGAAERFSTHGVLLSCTSGEERFRALRQVILGSSAVRPQRPHVTLAHPRNPRAPGNDLAAARRLGELEVTFTEVCHIRQDPGAAWRVVQRVPLAAAAGREA